MIKVTKDRDKEKEKQYHAQRCFIIGFLKKYCLLDGFYHFNENNQLIIDGKLTIKGFEGDCLPFEFTSINESLQINNCENLNTLKGLPDFCKKISLSILPKLENLDYLPKHNELKIQSLPITDCKNLSGGQSLYIGNCPIKDLTGIQYYKEISIDFCNEFNSCLGLPNLPLDFFKIDNRTHKKLNSIDLSALNDFSINHLIVCTMQYIKWPLSIQCHKLHATTAYTELPKELVKCLFVNDAKVHDFGSHIFLKEEFDLYRADREVELFQLFESKKPDWFRILERLDASDTSPYVMNSWDQNMLYLETYNEHLNEISVQIDNSRTESLLF